MVRPAAKQQHNKSFGITSATLVFIIGFLLGHFHSNLMAKSTPSSTSSGRLYGDGWHAIEVFYGKSDHLERMLPAGLEWFSQARQDEAVVTFLKGKRNGYFVDLASNDATVLSNTYSLEKKYGWSGLCIEPNPMYWANLTYRDCQVVAAVVGNQRMEEVHFRFDNGDHGGITGEQFDNGKNFKNRAMPKYTVTLKEILQRFDAPKQIDYLSLDVEGAEEFIMKSFPLQEYSISLMTVERPKDSLRALLEKHGFKYLKRLSSWGESLWAHDSIMGSLDLSRIEDFTPTRKPKPQAVVKVGSNL
jgi:Methyltransferase FkbM domain